MSGQSHRAKPDDFAAEALAFALRWWRDGVRGISLRDAGDALPMSHSHLGRMERCERPVPPELIPQLDRVYNADGRIEAFHVAITQLDRLRKGTLATNPPSRDEGDEMERRAAMQILAALGGGAVVPFDALETLRSGLDRALGNRSESSLEDWEQISSDYGHALVTQPSAQLVGLLAADVVELRATLPRIQSPVTRIGLQRVGSQLAAGMAMTLHNLSDLQSSWRWWRTARHAADASGDRDLSVWVRAREAGNSISFRPDTTVEALIEDAVRAAGRAPSVGLAQAFAVRAHLRARRGDDAGAYEALHDLAEVFARLPDGTVTDHASCWHWPESALRHTESGVYARLGDRSNAEVAIEQALALYPAERRVALAQIEIRRALCMVCDGDVSEGLDHATKIFDQLPTGYRTQYVMRDVNEVIDALPENAGALPAAQELRALTSA